MASPTQNLYARRFAADAETERALRAGLAGREARILRGLLAVALRTLASEPSTKLVFVDLDGTPEPETAARELTAVCVFGTAVVAIGSNDIAHLTRALLLHGITDYLVKPISAATVREASATALDDLPEREYAGRVVAFVGTAGSGTSTPVAAIARGVAADGRSASVVDLDPASGALSTLLDAAPAGDPTSSFHSSRQCTRSLPAGRRAVLRVGRTATRCARSSSTRSRGRHLSIPTPRDRKTHTRP